MQITDAEFNRQIVLLDHKLYGFALKLTHNPENAKDLVNDTILKAIVYKHQFKNTSEIKPWVKTIMRNNFINNYRRQKRSANIFDHSKDLYSVENHPGNVPISTYDEKYLLNLVNSLSPRVRNAIKLRIDGYDYCEIGKILNIAEGTVKSTIFNARKQLMKLL